MNIFAEVGSRVCEWCRGIHGAAEVLGETTAEFAALLFHPRRLRLGDTALVFQRAAFDGLIIVIVIGALLGIILAFECAAALQTFGVESYVANLLAIALFRELGPLVTAIILAGRTGSAFAAEIGTMKVDEELDALTTMGLPPVRFLVLPRILAAMLAMPILTIFCELAGIYGGAIVLEGMGVPQTVYWNGVISTTSVHMIVLGLVKGVFFGLLVAIIGCAAGMRTKSTADGVGVSATSAVVGGIIAIAVADGLLALICHIWGI